MSGTIKANAVKRKELLGLLRRKALHRGRVVLASGKISTYYFDARALTLHPQGLHLIVQLLWPWVKQRGFKAVGGPSVGADPLLAALTLYSAQRGTPLGGLMVRSEPKAHGLGRQVEGALPRKGSRVLVCDDTVTSGGSLIRAVEVLRAEGFKVKEVVAVVNRKEGADEKLQAAGCEFHWLFSGSEILGHV